ncbi:MAG: FHA domain-containing protein [Nitrospiraceae bacterium]|nr:MAG: FHA domain-containing protein [Nitrospiraceae bacterium]
MSKVMLKFKEAVLKEIPLDKDTVTIGRNPGNDIHIDNLAVSGFHAKLINRGGKFFIQDLNSTNGTFVNGKRISESALSSNDDIVIGKHSLIFISPQEHEEDQTETLKIKKPAMGETIIIDPKKHKAMIEEARAAGQAGLGEKLGGFTIIEGNTDKREYELAGRLTTIGKSDTSLIKLKGFFAPKVAALINRTKSGYFISPSEGKKLKVNGNAVEGRHELKDGDIVDVANIKMQFYIKE